MKLGDLGLLTKVLEAVRLTLVIGFFCVVFFGRGPWQPWAAVALASWAMIVGFAIEFMLITLIEGDKQTAAREIQS